MAEAAAGDAVSENSIEVLVDRDVFDAGDVIEGVVKLRLAQRIEAEELTVGVEGYEKVTWWERNESRSSSQQRVKRDILDERLVLATDAAYEPGEYEYAFTYRLPESLPASFAVESRSVVWMVDVNGSVSYTLKASLPVTSGLSENLETAKPLVVFAQRVAHPIRPVSAEVTKVVRAAGIISKGECSLSIQMDQDACISGDVLLVQASIHNRSSANMKSIKMKLFEDLTITVPRRTANSGSKKICESKMSGIRAGEQVEQVLSLPLLTESQGLPINPTTASSEHVHWTYRLVIKCSFVLATGVDLTIPIVVLPQSRPDPNDSDPTTVQELIVTTIEDTEATEVSKSLVSGWLPGLTHSSLRRQHCSYREYYVRSLGLALPLAASRSVQERDGRC